MKTLFQLDIPKRSKQCFLCNEPFKVGQDYYSLLLEHQDNDGHHRQDFCEQCWEKSPLHSIKKSFWKSKVFSNKELVKTFKNRDDKVLFLFKEALEGSAPDLQAEAYILALYLARRRYLYLRQEIKEEDGQVLCLFEAPSTEEMFTVKKYDVSSLAVQTIQANVAQKLCG